MAPTASALLLGILLLVPAPAGAAEDLSMGSAVLQMAWALAVVVGLILIIYALARRRFGPAVLRGGAISIVELRHIMPKTSLALVEVRGRELLLGVSAGNITLLADLSGRPRPGGETPDFEQVLQEKS
ncbi:MAG TPA: flagellar biosynthetic protein FliO [Desulfobulbus sp.]|nr:flagellar biosynthetic protein FliO [Desulfobulbus sp.]